MEREGRGLGRGSGKSLVGGGLGAGFAAGIGGVILGGPQEQPKLEFSHELEVLGKRDVDQDLSPAERREDFVRECELEMRLSFHCEDAGSDGEQVIHVHTPCREELSMARSSTPHYDYDPEVFHQATLERLGCVNSEYPGLYGATLDLGSKQKPYAEPTTKAWARILSAAALAGLLAVAALLCLFSFSSLVAEQQEGGRAEAFLKAHSTSHAAAMGGALERMKILHAGQAALPTFPN